MPGRAQDARDEPANSRNKGARRAMKRTRGAARGGSGGAYRGPKGRPASCEPWCHGDPRDAVDDQGCRHSQRRSWSAPACAGGSKWSPDGTQSRRRRPYALRIFPKPGCRFFPSIPGADLGMPRQARVRGRMRVSRVFALTHRVDFLTNLCKILRLCIETLALPLAGPSFWRMCARPCGGTARQTPSDPPSGNLPGSPPRPGLHLTQPVTRLIAGGVLRRAVGSVRTTRTLRQFSDRTTLRLETTC